MEAGRDPQQEFDIAACTTEPNTLPASHDEHSSGKRVRLAKRGPACDKVCQVLLGSLFLSSSLGITCMLPHGLLVRSG